MNKIKILTVIPETTLGHGFIFAKRQVNQLRELGCDVEVFYLKSRTNIITLVTESIRFKKMQAMIKPDIVHAQYGSVLGFFSVLFANVPVVVTFRGSDLNPNVGDNGIRKAFTVFLSQMAAFLASRIVCVSKGLESRLFWRKDISTVLPTGVNSDIFFPIDRLEARSKLGWSEHDRIIIFNTSSDNNPNKRLDLAKAATKIITEKFNNVKLVVLNGSIPPEMVNTYMNASDVLLMCSDYEGSPTVVQEALACNLPICSVNVGDVKEMIDLVKNCFIVERDPVSIAEGLFKLLEIPLRSNGRTYLDRYSSQINDKKLISIFLAIK